MLTSEGRSYGTTIAASGTKDRKANAGLLGRMCPGTLSVSVTPSNRLVESKDIDSSYLFQSNLIVSTATASGSVHGCPYISS